MIGKVNVTSADVDKKLEPVLGAIVFRGTWNANTNTPNLGGLTPANGDYYIVSVAGSTNLNGITSWNINDFAVYNTTSGWQKIDNTDSVTSVAGKTGAVTLDKNDVGLANVDNTSDANKPVSTAQQTALDLKAPINNPTFTGTVGGVSKSMVGLGNVDNTSDANKPVSTAQQAALDLKEALANKNANNGYMGLDSTGRAAQAQLPGLAIVLHMVVGDGSDGNLTFDGVATILGMAPESSVYTLTRDIYAANLTVNTGVKIFTDGYRIFVRGKLRNAGAIHFNGKYASANTGGPAYTNRGSMSISAGAGGNGVTSASVGGDGGGSGGNNVPGSSGGNGGTGGAFGGGAGNNSAAITAAQGGVRDIGFFNRARLLGGAAPNGSGGGGGGGGNPNTGTVVTGGGGGAAGGVAIACIELDNTNGVISADGGKGANATGTGDAVGGGGGGGAGGWVFIAAAIVTAQGTIRALGGAFGNGFGGGATGAAGKQGLVATVFPTGL